MAYLLRCASLIDWPEEIHVGVPVPDRLPTYCAIYGDLGGGLPPSVLQGVHAAGDAKLET